MNCAGASAQGGSEEGTAACVSTQTPTLAPRSFLESATEVVTSGLAPEVALPPAAAAAEASALTTAELAAASAMAALSSPWFVDAATFVRSLEPTRIRFAATGEPAHWTPESAEGCMELLQFMNCSASRVSHSCLLYDVTIYYRYAFVSVLLHFVDDDEGARALEWRRLAGDVCDSCDLYRRFARKCVSGFRAQGAVDVSGFADQEKSYEEKFAIADDDLCDLASAQGEDRKIMVDVVKHMVLSQWSKSQMEGSCAVAKVCERSGNARVLAQDAEMVTALARHVQGTSVKLSTVAASALLNMKEHALWPDGDEDGGAAEAFREAMVAVQNFVDGGSSPWIARVVADAPAAR